MALRWLTLAAGAALIVFALRDLFHSVFRPAGQGSISEHVMRAGWAVLRLRRSPRASGLAFGGPLLVLLVLATWTLMLLVGWAVIYWPRLSEFHPATGLPPGASQGFSTALYVSAVTLTTLGLGDLTPVGALLRVLMPLEALVGFGLFTATLSWILELYPVIARKRALARQISVLAELEERHGSALWELSAEVSERELASIADKLIDVTGQLVQMPASYYFEPRDERHSVAAQSGTLLACLRRAQLPQAPIAVRLRAELVERALDDLAHALRTRYLRRAPADMDGLLRAFHDEHVAEKPSGPESDVSP
jgi:hypothetical protein